MQRARPPSAMVWQLVRQYPVRAVISTAGLFGTGLLNAFGVAALLPLIGLAVGQQSGGEPTPIDRMFTSVFAIFGVAPTVEAMLLIVVLVMAAKAGLNLLALRQVAHAAAAVTGAARLRLIRAWMSARWGEYLSLRSGTLANAITNEAQRVGAVYNTSAKAAAELAQSSIYLALALVISWQVTIASMLIAATIVTLLWGLMRRTRAIGRQNTEQMSEFTARLVEGLRAMKTLKALAAEDQLGPLLESEVRRLERSGRELTALAHYLRILQEPLTVVALAVGIYVLLEVWRQPIESLVVLTVLFIRTVGSINSMQGSIQNLFSFEAAFWHVHDLVDRAERARETDGAENDAISFQRDIVLRSITFRHGENLVLNNASLTVPFGAFVAITGPSGAGKTTTADLLVRLFDPESGTIEVDGVPLQNVQRKAWRRMVGYVPQESLLFHDSILVNVTLGLPGVSRDDAVAALRAAEAWSFVEKLPNGIDTVVGELGGTLSGGQRQRIALARALARRPRLLILDEATTALDPGTEADIIQTLSHLSGQVTIVAVSHQPAMVGAAGAVYVIANGTISPAGSGVGARRPAREARP